MKISPLGCLALVLIATESLATELYNLDFTPPETGQYQVVFGTPTVQSSVGPLNNALVFDAVTNYEQISLSISTLGPRYEIEWDVLVHNLRNTDYQFAVLLDTPEVRRLDFDGQMNRISVYQPFAPNAHLGSFMNDQVYHLKIAVDLPANLWSIEVNGVALYSHAIDASSLRSVRFSMAPRLVGLPSAPGTYAAIDNVRVSVVPEPATALLLLVAVPGLLIWRRSAR